MSDLLAICLGIFAGCGYWGSEFRGVFLYISTVVCARGMLAWWDRGSGRGRRGFRDGGHWNLRISVKGDCGAERRRILPKLVP